MSSLNEIALGIATFFILIGLVKQEYEKLIQKRDSIAGALPKQAKANVKISVESEKVKDFLRADRVQIFEFHNGGRYADGRSALKLSCTFETVRHGSESTFEQLQNIPISIMTRLVSEIIENRFFDCRDVEQLKDPMPSVYAYKKHLGVKSFYDVALCNDKNQVVAVLVVVFVDKAHSELTLEQKTIIYNLKYLIENELIKKGIK